MNERSIKFACIAVMLLVLTSAALGQSSDQSLPTPVYTAEITGTIKPRDIGDSRLTSHFYTFEGGQGDLFINLTTTNFSGDIDLWIESGLRPLAKIVVYGDSSKNETGRVVYLRKGEKLLLRVQGRPPGDENASYRIKFAGSFIASNLPPPADQLPVVASADGPVKVNSAGTIIDVKKPEPAKEPVADPKPVAPVKESREESTAEEKPKTVKRPTAERSASRTPAPKPSPVGSSTRTAEKKPETRKPAARSEKNDKQPKRSEDRIKREKAKEESAADALANVKLIILFKDGRKIERPMTEVFRFTVDKGVLTVISTGGTIGRYSMADVARVTIE